MRSIAEYIMRGRMQATLAVAIMAIPGLFWVGAAVASLVLLRKGISEALQVSILGLIIALISWYFERTAPLMVLMGSLVLAQVLRVSMSWVNVLLASILVGIFCYWLFYLYPTTEMQAMSASFIPEFTKLVKETYQLTPEQNQLVTMVASTMIPIVYACGFQVFCLISLIVARYWQALLYNPGGFREEFYQLRLPIGITTILCVCMFIVPNLYYQLTILFLVCSIPLFICGLAVVHALLARTQFMGFGLIAFYAVFVILFYFIYPLLVILAILDSFLNIRKLSVKPDSNVES